MDALVLQKIFLKNSQALSASAFKTYCTLAVMKREGTPLTQAKIAAEVRSSLRTVLRHLKELESADYIRRTKGEGNVVDYEFTTPIVWNT